MRYCHVFVWSCRFTVPVFPLLYLQSSILNLLNFSLTLYSDLSPFLPSDANNAPAARCEKLAGFDDDMNVCNVARAYCV